MIHKIVHTKTDYILYILKVTLYYSATGEGCSCAHYPYQKDAVTTNLLTNLTGNLITIDIMNK